MKKISQSNRRLEYNSGNQPKIEQKRKVSGHQNKPAAQGNLQTPPTSGNQRIMQGSFDQHQANQIIDGSGGFQPLTHRDQMQQQQIMMQQAQNAHQKLGMAQQKHAQAVSSRNRGVSQPDQQYDVSSISPKRMNRSIIPMPQQTGLPHGNTATSPNAQSYNGAGHTEFSPRFQGSGGHHAPQGGVGKRQSAVQVHQIITDPSQQVIGNSNALHSMRASREQWNQQANGAHESNQNINLNQQLSQGGTRKLNNLRKNRYNNNGKIVDPNHGNPSQKSYRGPVIKNGLHISQTIGNQGPMMGGLPNSTKNQMQTVNNKFSSGGGHGRDVTPNKTMKANQAIGNQNQATGSVIAPGRAAHQGFQQQLPPGHSGRVQSLDISGNQPINMTSTIVPGSRGHPQQTPQIHLSTSAAPPQISGSYTTKNANNGNPSLSQSNFMQFGMNTISSPYAHGLAQKQITLQNQVPAPDLNTSGAPTNNKGSHKDIQLIQAYQQHTQRLKDQAPNYKKSRAAPRSIDTNAHPNAFGPDKIKAPSNAGANASPWTNQTTGTHRVQNSANYQNMNDHLNSVRQPQTNTKSYNTQNTPSAQINTQRVVPTQKNKLVDSKLSALRNEQDSTAASNINTRFPMSADEAFKIFGPYLWDIEKREIFEYKTIYFFPVEERKKQKSLGMHSQSTGAQSDYGVFNESTNNGFDNDQNEYIIRMNEHLGFRYEVSKKCGKGSFGVVLKCYDHKEREYCAIKILKNKKRLYKQGLVEAKLIKHLNDHDPDDKKNIIRRLDQFLFRKHLILSFEMLSVNLYEFIKMNNFQGFSLNLIKRFAIQILISLYYLNEHNIVHCDLKPENILLRKINKSGIKIIDFGSGCFETEKIYTYIQSRFYRAPEIVLGIPYNAAIDMWSFGCILYELYVGYPLFPGEDEKDHMALMMEVKGIPPRSVLARSSRRKVFFDEDYNPIIQPNSRGKIRIPGNKNLFSLMNCSDKDFVDFIDKCIEWKHDTRMTPEQAFSHPFISKAVNELKCLKEQPAPQSSQPSANSDQPPSHRSAIQGGKTKSRSQLPTIRGK